MTEPPCLVLDAASVSVDDVGPALTRVTTGWRLRIVGPEREALLLRAAALAHGALDAEITVEVVDRDASTVFCAHCHHSFPTSGRSATCPACGIALRVADHVSRQHGAYLGEPT